MLLGASATCFLITYAAMLERAEIPVESLTLESEAEVDVSNNVFTFQAISHYPSVLLAPDSETALVSKAEKLAVKAEQSCMISKALAGNVMIHTEANVRMKE